MEENGDGCKRKHENLETMPSEMIDEIMSFLPVGDRKRLSEVSASLRDQIPAHRRKRMARFLAMDAPNTIISQLDRLEHYQSLLKQDLQTRVNSFMFNIDMRNLYRKTSILMFRVTRLFNNTEITADRGQCSSFVSYMFSVYNFGEDWLRFYDISSEEHQNLKYYAERIGWVFRFYTEETNGTYCIGYGSYSRILMYVNGIHNVQAVRSMINNLNKSNDISEYIGHPPTSTQCDICSCELPETRIEIKKCEPCFNMIQ